MSSRARDERKRAHRRALARAVRRDKGQFKKRIRRYVIGTIVGLGGLAIVLSLVLPSSIGRQVDGQVNPLEIGSPVEIQVGDEIPVGDSHPPYTTSPPTSGWHYGITDDEIKLGSRQESIQDETQVAYLERGAVLVQYNCPEECPDLVEQLRLVVNRYPEKVFLAPYENMESTISLTSWGWIDTLDDFDDGRIDQFIQAHIDNGPKTFE